MLTITTSKATVLAVILPKGATEVEIEEVANEKFLVFNISDGTANARSSRLIKRGSWQPLGFVGDLSESQKLEIVEQFWLPELSGVMGVYYPDYTKERSDYKSTDHVSWKYSSLTKIPSKSFETWKSKHGISEEHYLLVKII